MTMKMKNCRPKRAAAVLNEAKKALADVPADDCPLPPANTLEAFRLLGTALELVVALDISDNAS